MACGTPVIAFRCGAVPEVIEHGVTGFVVDTMEEAIEAAKRVRDLDRQQIRKRFEERFTSGRMARDYVAAYQTLLSRSKPRAAPSTLQSGGLIAT
jgi:glycosyltransferase involved in cell wall biosynthesis